MLSTEERPPMLRFEKTAVEDRVASDQVGKLQYMDIIKVYVRAPGDTKSEHVDIAEKVGYDITTAEVVVEKEITKFKEVDGEVQEVKETVSLPETRAFPQKKIVHPWLDKLKALKKDGRISDMHFNYCMDAFKRFKSDEEAPINGTPLAMWPAVSEAVKKKALECGIRSIEDAAQMTSEAMANIGMGAGNLKNLAIAYVNADREPERNAREMLKLQEQNEAMQEQMSAMAAKLAELDQKPKKQAKAA